MNGIDRSYLCIRSRTVKTDHLLCIQNMFGHMQNNLDKALCQWTVLTVTDHPVMEILPCQYYLFNFWARRFLRLWLQKERCWVTSVKCSDLCVRQVIHDYLLNFWIKLFGSGSTLMDQSFWHTTKSYKTAHNQKCYFYYSASYALILLYSFSSL